MTPRLTDAGAQAERTLLAWLRIVLAAGAVLAVAVRELVVRHPVVALVVLGCVPAAGAVAILARRRYRAVGGPGGLGRSGGAGLLALGGASVVAGGIAMVIHVLR